MRPFSYYWRQFRAIFLKNWALRKREKATNCCQISTPILLLFILVGLQASLSSSQEQKLDQDTSPNITDPFFVQVRPGYGDIPGNDEGWFLRPAKILYSEQLSPDMAIQSNLTFEHLVRYVPDELDDISKPYSTSYGINGSEVEAPVLHTLSLMNSSDDITKFLYDSWDYTYGTPYDSAFEVSTSGNNLNLLLFTNFSISWYVDLPFTMTMITQSISSRLSGGRAVIRLLGNKFFPQQKGTIDFDISSLAGAFFYMLILHQLLPIFMSTLVYEKEHKLREVMKMMGMNMTMYWIVNYIYFYVLYLVLVFFLCITGFLVGFRFFTINSPATYWILFILWGHTLIGMGYLGSALINHSKTATLIGYFFMVAVDLLATYLIDTDINDPSTSSGKLFAISLFPSFALYRGLVYLNAQVSWEGPGIKMSDISDPTVNLGAVYGHLVVEWIVLMFLAWYLEQVVPSTYGVKKPPLFLFTKTYWTGKGTYQHYEDEVELHEITAEDVQKEFTATMDPDNDVAVRIKHLRKVFERDDNDDSLFSLDFIRRITSHFGATDNSHEASNRVKVAVKDLTMTIRHGECLGFLGHNGAGKTTTINMLCGLYAPSAGTAEIFGRDLRTDLEEVYQIMGVCPQHDVLWETMNAKDHLLFYGRLKGLRGKTLTAAADEVLKKVNLYDVRNKLAGKYSGGMKRRLSVAIALMGKPKLIFLDEPSTGLDPASKRTLWDVISEAKSHASMLLTTHSMEEADALCDRLAIFSAGELRTIGYSNDLKLRFGAGFKVSISIKNDHPEFHERLLHFMKQMCPGATLQSEMLGHFTFEVPASELTLSTFFRAINENKEQLGIVDWGIGNTTLEEVFVHVVETTWDEAVNAKAKQPPPAQYNPDLKTSGDPEISNANNVLFSEN